MMHKNNQPGYILAVTLALIALCMFITTYVFNKGFVFSRFSQTMVDREKSRQLAYGGIQLAISQLAIPPKNPQQAQGERDEKKLSDPKALQAEKGAESTAKNLIKAILPIINKAQKFILKQSIDGVNGELSITLGSEEGKININRLYDFDKHKFIGEGQPNGDMKKIAQEIFALIKEKMNLDLFGDFEKFLKERKYPLNDVTELLKIPSFEIFKSDLFYDSTNQNNNDPQKQKIYLTDLFTIASPKKEIEPWLLSNSMMALLKLNRANAPAVDDLLKNFKEQSDWKTDWNKIFKPFYDVEYNALPKSIAPLFNPTFAPKIFSVLSQATVNKVSVRIFAILELEKGAGKDAAPIIHIRSVYLV